MSTSMTTPYLLSRLLTMAGQYPDSSSDLLAELCGGDLDRVQALVRVLAQHGLLVQTDEQPRPNGRRPQPLYSLAFILPPSLAQRLITTGSLMAMALEQLRTLPPYGEHQASLERMRRTLPAAWQALMKEVGIGAAEILAQPVEGGESCD